MKHSRRPGQPMPTEHLVIKAAVLLAAVFVCGTGFGQSYIYQLPPIPPDTFLDIDGITDDRLAGGIYIPLSGGRPQAFVFDGFQFQLFDPPPEIGLGADGGGMNNRAHIVGEASHQDGRHGSFLLKEGAFSFIHAPGSARTTALDINDSGTVIGLVEFDNEDKGKESDQGFVWQDGQIQLFSSPSYENTTFLAIDNYGIILGVHFDNPIDFKHFLFDGTEFTSIDIDVPGAARTVAASMNDWGVVAGSYWESLEELVARPFIFDGVTYTKLEGPEGGSAIKTINNNFDLVGRFREPDQEAVGFIGYFGDNDDILQPKGDILAKVTTLADIDSQSGRKIDTTMATLYLQEAQVRQQVSGESDNDYRAFLESQPRQLTDRIVTAIEHDGLASFADVPVFQLQSRSGRQFVERAYYSLDIRETSTEECVPGPPMCAETQRVFFTNALIPNLVVDQINPQELTISLLPLDAIVQKRELIDTLTRLGPEHYTDPENQASSIVDVVENTPTPAGLECIRRSVYAERLALSAARFSQDLIGDMLGGVEALIHDLIDDVLVSKNAQLQKSSKRYDNLKAELDLERLQNQNWIGFQGGDEAVKNRLLAQMSVLRDSDQALEISLFAETAQVISNAVFSAVNAALVEAKMEESVAAATAKDFKDYVDTLLKTAITQGVSGAAPAVKRAISEITKANRSNLFDSPVPYAYTALSNDSLAASATLMAGCNSANPAGFLSDRSEYNLVNQQVGDLQVISKSITAYSTAISDAFGGQGAEIIGLLGPKGRAVKKIMDVAKYASNGITFGVPALSVYGGMAGPNVSVTSPWPLPGDLGSTLELGLLDKGVAAIYGVEDLPGKSGARNSMHADRLIRGQKLTGGKQILLFHNMLNDASETLVIAIETLASALAADDFINVIESIAGENSALHANLAFGAAVSDIGTLVQGTDMGDAILSSQQNGFALERAFYEETWARTFSLLDTLIYDVLLLTTEGPDDSEYRARRDHIAAELASMITRIDVLTSAVAAVTETASTLITSPAITVANLQVLSNKSATSSISETNETFRVSATIRNLGNEEVNGLSAVLSSDLQAPLISIDSSTEQPVGNGTLGAYDGIEGSGPDEIEIEWPITFTGDPGVTVAIPLYVDLLENAEAPVTFRPGVGVGVLETRLEVTDSDQDGLPDEWEQTHGLSIGQDDAQFDTDADLLSNEVEFQIGSNPNNPDSDADGLTDGDEVLAGANMFATDPLNQDTDGDGDPDNTDESPLDATTSKAPPPGAWPGEPVVEVGKIAVLLDQSNPVATIQVGNAGSGVLNWTAFPANKAIAIARPTAPMVRSGEGILQIRAASTFNFEQFEPLKTHIRVMDISGNVRDYRDIQVIVGNLADQIFLDGFE